MLKYRLILTAAWTFFAALVLPAVALANIDLEWRPEPQTVLVGETVNIGLYAVSDDPEGDQEILAMDVILNWEPGFLELIGVDNNGPYAWLFSSFPVNDPDGLNDTFADGDALYTALGVLGAGAWATPDGLLVTTFQFTALAETPGTTITIPEDAGGQIHTAVWGSPGLDVHGTLGSAALTIVADPQGACCLSNGTCLELTEADCAAVPCALWAGPFTDCTDGNQNGAADECEGLCICGDLDCDGGPTDLGDFNRFQVCFSLRGPTEQCPQFWFDCADLDGNDWVNLTDFNTFQVLFGTVNTNRVPNCLDK